MLALARHGEAGPLQLGDDLGPVAHQAILDPALHHRVQERPVDHPFRSLQRDLPIAGQLRVIGPRPAVLDVQGIAQRCVQALPARRRDVEGPAARQLHARRHEVKLDPAALRVAVPDPQHVVLVGIEAGERRALELVHHHPLLLGARRVARRERHDAACVAPVPVDRVDEIARHLRIAAQHLGRCMLTVL